MSGSFASSSRLQLRDTAGSSGALLRPLLEDDGDALVTLRAPDGLQEVDVELTKTLAGSLVLVRLSEWLGRAVAASATTLRSLRLSGPLHLAAVFRAVAPVAAQCVHLEQVYLACGGADWGAPDAAEVLRKLPALQRLHFRFSFDDEHPPQDLLNVMLRPGPPPPPVLSQLRHLAVVWTPRSVIPPSSHLPAAMATMTQLTSLKLKRYPVLSVPGWLGSLTQLRYLLWDPALPADKPYSWPPGLEGLTNLRCLWIVHQVPLVLPASLAGTLEGIHVMGRRFREEAEVEQPWGWLQPFSKLTSVRLQGLDMHEVPRELLDKSQLTRLDLMCNAIEELPAGPYLSSIRTAHLGGNCFTRFPSAILGATQLEALDLANQSAPASANSGCSTPGDSGASAAPRLGAGATQRLALGKTDVDGLLALRCLHTVVMNNMQPIVRIGEQSPHDFTWLQRVLKQGGVRLTSNELAYQLQSKEVFDLLPLIEAADSASSSARHPSSSASWMSEGGTPTSQHSGLSSQGF